MIPKTAPSTGINVHGLSDGRWQVTCGKCLRTSEPVTADDPEVAWSALQSLGWAHYRATPTSTGYPICPPCVGTGETIEDAVRAARKKRRCK